MSTPVLATKLFITPLRPGVILRPRLIERLNEGLRQNQGLGNKLILISAPAGFGKTTLVSEWIAKGELRAAWLSLDNGDSDPTRFLIYLVAALQTIAAGIGAGVMAALQSSPPPATEAILTALLNEITVIPDSYILVLDDYHVIDAQAVDHILGFLLEHLPPQMHLVIATREDPQLPLARLRARGQLTELRAADLRFTSTEAAAFLNQAMDLSLSPEDVAALENHTEGWIAGLQMAALSMQGREDAPRFIQAFTGGHHFVVDYLVEEVLQRQPENIQTFLLRTSILDRMCGPLCDAVCSAGTAGSALPSVSGQETLEYLERANLFILPLDNERRWYRYHHLFADLLRQRLGQKLHKQATSAGGKEETELAEYHRCASIWYEDNGLDFEAFHHAAAAHDVERAERLIEGKGMPLHMRGAATAIVAWLGTLPVEVLDARPSLWVKRGTLTLVMGQRTGVEESLQAAEAALQGAELNDRNRNLIGQIAAARATLALTRYQVDSMLTQSLRALEYLHPKNLTFLTTANWTLGEAYYFQGNRGAANRAFTEAVALGSLSGDIFSSILAIFSLALVQEVDNQLYTAAETYRHGLRLFGDFPQPNASEALLGLARICYEWNDLAAAEQHAQQSLQLARQYERGIDRFVICEVFLARLKLAQGDVAGAQAILSEADQSTRQNNFVYRMPEVAAGQVILLLRQGDRIAAAQLAQSYDLPLCRARVYLAQGDPQAALAVLAVYRQQMEAKGWADERLKAMVLQSIALYAHREKDQAMQVLADALALAEPGGFIRIFVDEGAPMAQLLFEAAHAGHGVKPDYTGRLLAAFGTEARSGETSSDPSQPRSLIEPLSQRELEVLRLIAQGLSNREICERLFLALNTVKGHNRIIFDKLQVQSRTEAVARARELGLL